MIRVMFLILCRCMCLFELDLVDYCVYRNLKS